MVDCGCLCGGERMRWGLDFFLDVVAGGSSSRLRSGSNAKTWVEKARAIAVSGILRDPSLRSG